MHTEPEDPGGERHTLWRFGDLTLDPARRRVRRNGKNLRLGGLTYELLALLVACAPRLVSYEEIAAKLWAGRIATPETIRQRAKLLRSALSDDADKPRYVRVVHGQGLRLIPDVEEVTRVAPNAARRRRMAIVAIAIIAALVAWLVEDLADDQATRQPGTSTDLPPAVVSDDHWIAILPFENLTGDEADDWFINGFHSDLLTQLSKLPRFKVISRTSVLEYRNTQKNLRKIGEELNVEHILEGSVQRIGDKVRINAQLIDTRSDAHLWAERFDRPLSATNLFEIQSEMATSVAGALKAVLSPEDIARMRVPPTTNLRAYHHYLMGKEHLRDVDNGSNHQRAVEEFQQAVSEDPGFALAWALLGRSHSAVYFFGDRSDTRLDSAREAIERASAIEPDLPEVHLARGYYLYHGFRDYDGALREWSVAELGIPGDARLFQARGYVHKRMGQWNKALNDLNQAVRLDPRNMEVLTNLAALLASLRYFDEADLLFDRIIEVAPDSRIGYALKGYTYLRRDGDAAAAERVVTSTPLSLNFPLLQWEIAVYQRDYGKARQVLDGWPVQLIDNQHMVRPKSWFVGITQALAGDESAAGQSFGEAASIIEARLKDAPDDVRLLVTMADLRGQQGDRAAAVTLAERAMRLMPADLDAIAANDLKLSAALALVAAGEFDAGAGLLDEYLSAPGMWSIEGLIANPRFDRIRDLPVFRKLVQRHAIGTAGPAVVVPGGDAEAGVARSVALIGKDRARRRLPQQGQTP